ncbi:MAG: hypothetical protein ACRYE9_02645 [Janthinobacterium lividum]
MKISISILDCGKSLRISLLKSKKFTLRRILAHTAGLNVHGFPGYSSSKVKIPAILDILNGKSPGVNTQPVAVVQKPGHSFLYSGGGTIII